MMKLERNTHYELPNGATIFVVSHKDQDDGILYQPKANNTTVHVYSPGLETESDIHVYFNDNLKIDMWGFRKDNPTYRISTDEFPIKVELDDTEREFRLVTKQRGEENV